MKTLVRSFTPAARRKALAVCASFAMLAVSTATAQTSGYVFSTLAGRPLLGSSDGPADQASFAQPESVAIDPDGNIYVADTLNSVIRKISPSRVVSTFAGAMGIPGSADGTGSAARFSAPVGIAIDRTGNLYVSDGRNFTIRMITPAGVVSTLAGLAGAFGSVDGTGAAARFTSPTGVAVDRNGNVYVADSGNFTLRKITPAGAVTTLAGQAGSPGSTDGVGGSARFNTLTGLAVDGVGNVFVADSNADTIREVAPDGSVTTIAGLTGIIGGNDGVGSAARFSFPTGVAVDGSGNLYVTELLNCTVRKIAPGGIVTTLAGAAGQSGDLDGAGGGARFAALGYPAVDPNGNLIVPDEGNGTIRQVTPAGQVTTIAGLRGSLGHANGPGSAARFSYPAGLAADQLGNLYVAEGGQRTVRKISPAGIVSDFAGSLGQSGSADGVGAAACFGYPDGLAADAAGNIYVSDSDNFNIRKIAPDGTVSTLAGQTGFPGWSDGVGAAAQFNSPAGLAIDRAGNLYVADRDGPTIRKITPEGVVTTFAGQPGVFGAIDGPPGTARLSRPVSLAIDQAGNIFFIDGSITVRKVAPDGTVTTIAGRWNDHGTVDGPGNVALFTLATSLAIDSLGNLFVTEGDNVVRRITPDGVVSTIAGLSGAYGSTDGADAAVRFNFPTAIAIDPSGHLFIADSDNNTIREGASTTRLINLSVRASVGAGDQTLIVGYVITGSSPKPVLMRAVGPGLVSDGILNALPDPEFKVFDHNAHAFLANDNWGGLQPDLSSIFTRLGAQPLDEGSKDAAIYATLAPGLYTTHVDGGDGGGGIALAEVYDGDDNVGTRLVNVSARSVTGGGENVLIAGLVLGGHAPKTVLVRAVGPSLVGQGVSPSSVLVDPTLTLYRNNTAVGANDDWGGAPALKAVFQQVGAFSLAADTSKDAALLVTLDPGVYSVVVQGGDLTPGVALVEVYEVP